MQNRILNKQIGAWTCKVLHRKLGNMGRHLIANPDFVRGIREEMVNTAKNELTLFTDTMRCSLFNYRNLNTTKSLELLIPFSHLYYNYT